MKSLVSRPPRNLSWTNTYWRGVTPRPYSRRQKVILTADIESRSKIGISGGAWKYAAHPSTEIICIGVKVDDHPTRVLWTGHIPKMMRHNEMSYGEFESLMLKADRIIAHNAEFEFAMFKSRVDPYQLTWKDKLYCTMAQAAMCGLPMSLEKACGAIKAPIQKDRQGNIMMKKVCQPLKDGSFIEDEEILLRIGEYCRTDVEATYNLYKSLPEIPHKEQRVWHMNLAINERGVKVDRQMVEEILCKEKVYKAKLSKEFTDLTGIPSPSCIQQTLSWLAERGLELPNLTAPIVTETLNLELTPPVRRCLELRKELSKTSVKKYGAMADMMMSDDRLRGMFCYHGAATGRWAGRGVQPHNLPRGKHKDIEDTIPILRDEKYPAEAIEFLYGPGSFYPVCSSAIRSAFIAEKKFICCDFSAIEARVLAWLAGESKVLKAFEEDKDLYVTAAAAIYGVREEDVTPDQRQIGKVAVLACGYQGGKGAFASMANAYGVEVSEEQAQDIVTKWREANPMIVSWWKELGDAAVQAVKVPTATVLARSVSFKMDGMFLTAQLPSGRKLYYPHPRIITKETPWGAMVEVVAYWTMNTGRWMEVDTYGGKLSENLTQAVARDLLVECMGKYHDLIVLHIHDELVLDTDKITLDEVVKVMATPPTWAKGLPMAATGWQGRRYKK